MNRCPEPSLLAQFAVGSCDEDQLGPIAEHLDTCVQCQVEIETLGRADAVQQMLQGPRGPASSECESAIERASEILLIVGRDTPNSEEVPLGSIRDYQLLAKIGQGGMGTVYSAVHKRLRKTVAIKVLSPQRLSDETAVVRFDREMQAIGTLDHPNLVRALDAGEDQGRHYLVMEHLQGCNLSELVKRIGPLPLADACEIVRQVALGLQHAHEHGLVHRDIKPGNLMLTSLSGVPVVKVLDLGLALLGSASDHQRELTGTGQVMGTVDYMAPEQATDTRLVDIRADIYSLGATLYKLLTGEAIFPDERYPTPISKLMAHANAAPRSVRELRPELPPELDNLIERMLAKRPADRPTAPAEVVAALAPLAAGHRLSELAGAALAGGVGSSAEQNLSRSTAPPSPSQLSDTTRHLPPIKSSPAAAPPRSMPVHVNSRAGRFSTWLPLAVGGVLLAFGGIVALAAAMVYFFQTPQGTLRVEINDPDIEVAVKGTDIVIKHAATEDITLTPGEHALVVKRGDFSFETNKLLLKKGETVTVNVELLAGKVLVTQGERILGDLRLPETTADAQSVAVNRSDVPRANESPLDQLDPTKVPPAERAVWEAEGVSIPGAQLVAVCGDHRHGGDPPYGTSVAFHPSGKYAASCGGLDADGSVCIWDVSTMRPLERVPLPEPTWTAFSSCEKWLAVRSQQSHWGSDKSIIVFHFRDGKLQQRLKLDYFHPYPNELPPIYFLPDSSRLLYSETKKVTDDAGKEMYHHFLCLYDVEEEKEIWRKSCTGLVRRLALDREGKLAIFNSEYPNAGESVYEAVVFHPDTGEVVRTIPKLGKQTLYELYADGTRLICSSAGHWPPQLQIWDLEAGKVITTLNPQEFVWHRILRMSPDEKQAIYFQGHGFENEGKSADVRMKVLDVSTMEMRFQSRDFNQRLVRAADFSPDGSKLLTIGESGDVRLWDAQSGDELFPRVGHRLPVHDCCFSPDGSQLATASRDSTVRIWNVTGAAPAETAVRYLHGPVYEYPGSLRFLSDQKQLACIRAGASNGRMEILSLESPEKSIRTNILGSYATFSTDERRLLCNNAWQEPTTLWDLSNPTEPQSYVIDTPASCWPKYAPDLSFGVVSSKDKKLQIWDFTATAGSMRCEVQSGYDSRFHCAIHPEHRQFATVGAMRNAFNKVVAQVKIWRMTDGEPVADHVFHLPHVLEPLPYEGHLPAVLYSHDGRMLIFAKQQRQVTFYDLAESKIIHDWTLPQGASFGNLASDGRHIAIKSALGAVSILRLE